MKLQKTASGYSVKMSKNEWTRIGTEKGWIKEAATIGDQDLELAAQSFETMHIDDIAQVLRSLMRKGLESNQEAQTLLSNFIRPGAGLRDDLNWEDSNMYSGIRMGLPKVKEALENANGVSGDEENTTLQIGVTRGVTQQQSVQPGA